MVFKFLSQLKLKTTESQFKEILQATEQDIKFNRVSFGKTTSPIEFIEICTRCACLIIRLGGTGGDKYGEIIRLCRANR
ncbi:hypothetical protein GND98_004155 [Clostridium butyricum]|uniref:Uncharacterized protein n=1 Tax=Clostridium butyricum TaxID=1492 RepID=A0A6L9EKQ7_CLOBU|nr:hypothetical protein [Clostridium butyricum]